MSDVIFNRFLNQQTELAEQFADSTDLVSFVPCPADEPVTRRWLIHLNCRGLRREEDGDVTEDGEFAVGIWFPDDYLRRVNPVEIVTWLHPRDVWHPNILGPAGAMCLGHIAPGTPLLDLVYRCADIISYHNWASHDALNHEAAQWARNNQSRFPVDTRPLKWRHPK